MRLPLGAIPDGLRIPLLESFQTIVRNFREGRWEPAELNGGKLCEIVITILRGHVSGAFDAAPSKPANMFRACVDMEKADDQRFPRSVRIQVPRAILGLYEIRNNRGVGHAGGDVNPNHMDAVYVLMASKWIMAELIRIFHNVDTKSATETVDALVDRTIPIVWEVAGKKRVLRNDLSMLEGTLVLLYGTTGPLGESDLIDWVGHSNPSVYRRDVLLPAHKRRLIEYSRETRTVQLSPLGTRYVEDNIPLDLA
jgi:hypothetical protein